MKTTLIATSGTSINGIHNILFAHHIKRAYEFDKIILLLTEKLTGKFFEDVVERIEKSNSEMNWNLPKPEKRTIPGENLIKIRDAIMEILKDYQHFVLDITAGRKIMAVGATIAFQQTKAEHKELAYYLLKGDTTTPATDRLIQQLLPDEWTLDYYKEV